jgi:hypothetical protein
MRRTSIVLLVLCSGVATQAIVNGHVVNVKDIPAVVELFVPAKPGCSGSKPECLGRRCTATIIGCQTLLTGAHCTLGEERDAHFSIQDRQYEVRLEPSRFYSHDVFRHEARTNDLSLGLINKCISEVKPATVVDSPAWVLALRCWDSVRR